MSKKYELMAGVLMISILAGCAKKPVVKPTPPPPPPVVERVEEPTVRAEWQNVPELKMVNFDFDKSEIRSDAKEILKKNVEYIKANPALDVLVEGHCDERGTTEYNLALGQRRATAVREYYGRLGVSLARIATISYGEEKPLEFASNESAWAKNRRGETKIRKR